MSATRFSAAEKDLEKFIKFLALKTVQVVVQSRLGVKVQTQCNPQASGNDWFNVVIQDHPDVLSETKRALALNACDSIIQRLPLCIEISLRTVEGDKMILEVWSLALHPEQADPTARATHSIYNRMGILLKSLISFTRATPAYKLSRRQSTDSYHIYYRIYVNEPQTQLLGDGFKQVRVGQLSTTVGTLSMSVAYRTKMTISPTQTGRDTTIMLKSDHFLNLSPKNARYHNNKKSEKRVIDLDKPLRPGAFADVSKLKVYTEEDYILPETPPFAWLLRKTNETFCACKPKDTTPEEDEVCTAAGTTTNNNNNAKSNQSNDVKMTSETSTKELNGTSTVESTSSSPSASGIMRPEKFKWYEPLPESDKLLKEMHFPFATNRNSQSSDLAKFIRSCFNPPKLQQYEEQTLEDNNIVDDISKQLEQFETNLVDFDTLVSSLTLPPLDDNSNS